MRVVHSPRHLDHDDHGPRRSSASRSRRTRSRRARRGSGRPSPPTAGSRRRRPTSTARRRSPPSTTRGCSPSCATPGTTRGAPGTPTTSSRPRRSAPASPTEGMSDAVVREPPHPTAGAGHRALDTSTYILAGTYGAARAAVDVALTTVDLVLTAASPPPTGCAGRPGTTRRARCTAASATSTTRRSPPRRSREQTGEHVAILDVDYHHGNGTEQIFWRRGDVLYVSLHAHPDREYPYFLGWEDEVGEGEGRGANLNIPLPPGLDDAGYLAALDRGPGADRGRAGLGRRGLARASTPTAGPDRRLQDHDGRLPRGRAAGGRPRPAARDPPGGRLPRADARAERPGLAPRRRGPAVRPGARGSRARRRRVPRLGPGAHVPSRRTPAWSCTRFLTDPQPATVGQAGDSSCARAHARREGARVADACQMHRDRSTCQERRRLTVAGSRSDRNAAVAEASASLPWSRRQRRSPRRPRPA